jgi:hypothetical protein
MQRSVLFATAVLMMSQPLAYAHELEKGPNGGQVVDDKGHHIEFTIKDQAIVIHLTGDKDAPIASVGAEAKAIIQVGGKTTTEVLIPADPNILTGKLAGPLSSGAKIVVSGKLSDGHQFLARFVAR